MLRPEGFINGCVNYADFKTAAAYVEALGWGNLRPWDDFVAHMPSLPVHWKSWKDFEKHSVSNLLYYRNNYFYILLGTFVLFCISRPGFFLAGFFSGMITLGLFSVNTARYPSEVRAIIQPVTVRLAICAVVWLLLLWITDGILRFVMVVIVAFLLCLSHAVLRPVKKVAKLNEVMSKLKVNFTRVSYDVPEDSGAKCPRSPGEGDEEEGTGAPPMWSGTAGSFGKPTQPTGTTDAFKQSSTGEQRRRHASSSGSAQESSATEMDSQLPRPNAIGPKSQAPRRAPVPGGGGAASVSLGGAFASTGTSGSQKPSKPATKSSTAEKTD